MRVYGWEAIREAEKRGCEISHDCSHLECSMPASVARFIAKHPDASPGSFFLDLPDAEEREGTSAWLQLSTAAWGSNGIRCGCVTCRVVRKYVPDPDALVEREATEPDEDREDA